MKYILHITDLHLSNFKGEDEHLREGFYQEYIDEFTKKLSNINIDFVLITGDLIDRGNTENYNQVKIIIDYLITKLNISSNKVGFCIGNHDYKYKDDNGTNSMEVRSPYYNFTGNYSNKNYIFKNDRFSLIKIDNDLFFLSIDSTLDTKLHENYAQLIESVKENKINETRNKPGNISTIEIDEILLTVRKYINRNTILLIGCHYPIEKFPASAIYSDENDYDKNHIWDKAALLRTRINRLDSLKTCWFFGDTHAPDTLIDGNSCYIMTGRFGTSKLIASQIPRQAKVIKIDSNNDPTLITINCTSHTHTDSDAIYWKKETSRIRTISNKNNLEVEEVEIDSNHPFSNFIDLINEDIETAIVNKVIKNDLYSFGRFRTAHNSTSLGWISINPLLNSGEILPSIVTKSKKRILSVLNIDPEFALIIGLEFWGSIIGSQVSIVTGIMNYCVATRGEGKFHSHFEMNNNFKSDLLQKAKDVILFIDVVSCGETVHKFIENFEAIKVNHSITTNTKYHIISVITDNNQYNSEYKDRINSFGTFCTKLRIPVVKDNFLPSTEILPYNIDFSTKP